MSIRRTEGGGHKFAQVKQETAPGENREKLNHLLARTSRPETFKRHVKTLINRANSQKIAVGEKVRSFISRPSV